MARVFIGIPISEQLKKLIIQQQENLDNFPLKLIKKNNLHLTLVPPWEEAHPEIIIELLKKIQCSQFQIKFNEIGYGPNKLNPRMLWLKSQGCKEALHLKKTLTKILNFPKEERKFNPHITIAKFKPENFHSISKDFQPQKIEWQFPATQFILYESHISGSGSDYKTLFSFNLF